MNKLRFDHQYIKCDNFKSKQTPILRNMLEGARIGKQIKFNNYGNISFDKDDEKHEFPIIDILESFHRTKTNWLIYDIIDGNPDFNKLYVYQSINSRGNGGFYGFLLYNEETNKLWHKYFVDRVDDELCRIIWSTLWLLTNQAKEIYGEFIWL